MVELGSRGRAFYNEMNHNALPQLAELTRMLDYCPDTGALRWRIRRGGKAVVGSAAGYLDKDGYCVIGIHGRSCKAHRIAWKMATGADPAAEIDHRDGNPRNNGLSNLREATRGENNQNTSRRFDNTSGHKGCYWDARTRKWEARLMSLGRSKYLGSYTDLNDAIAAVTAARTVHHGAFANPG